MRTFDVTQPTPTAGTEWTPLATGQYVMEIAEAKIGLSPFKNDEDEYQEELTIVWKLAEWNDDHAAAGYEQGQRVYQRMKPWYGTGARGDSKFKQFIDPLVAEELIPQRYEIAADDYGTREDGTLYTTKEADATKGHLIGIRRKVMVDCYKKTMGKNAGQPGNKVLAVAPLRAGVNIRTNGNGTPTPPPSRPVQAAPAPSNEDFPLDGSPTHADLAEVIEQIGDLPENVLREYAPHFARMHGAFIWTSKPWSTLTEAQLREHIEKMWAGIERKRNPPADPNNDLGF